MGGKGTLAYEWSGTPPTPLESVAITLQMWKLNPSGSTETYSTVDVANSTEINLKSNNIKGIIPLDECPPELLYAITLPEYRNLLSKSATTEDIINNTWQMRVLVRSWDDAYSRVDVSLPLDTLATLSTAPFTLFGGNLTLTFNSPTNGSSSSSSPTRKPPPPRKNQTKSSSSTSSSSSPSPEKYKSSSSQDEPDDEENDEDDRWDRSPVSASSSPSSTHATDDMSEEHEKSSPIKRKLVVSESDDTSEGKTDEDNSSSPHNYQYQQKSRSLREEIRTLEAKITTLKEKAAELDKRGAGIYDMEARANREIKARKAADARRTEAEAEVEKLKNELKVLESSRMVADRTATENAEVAIAWKERSEGWESAYEALKKDYDTLNEKVVQLELTASSVGTNDKESILTSSPSQRPRSPLPSHPSPLSIPKGISTPTNGSSSGRNSPVPMPPSINSAFNANLLSASSDLANINATTIAVNELQERHNIRIKELENQIHLLRSECDTLRSQTTKETNKVRSLRHALSAARTCLASYASTIERACIDVENQVGTLMNYTFPRDEVRSAISSLHSSHTMNTTEDTDNDNMSEPIILHSSSHAALAKHGTTAINIALRALEEIRKTGYDAGTKASESKLAELRKNHDTLFEERSKLVRDWEQYASHWENRGREAERLNIEWEKSFDTQQQQLVNISKERDDIKHNNEILQNDLQQLRTLSETAIQESMSLRDYLTALGHGAAVNSLSRGLTKLSNAIMASNNNSSAVNTTNNNTPGNSTTTVLTPVIPPNNANRNNQNNNQMVNPPNNRSTTATVSRPIPHIPPTIPLSIPPMTMSNTNTGANPNNTNTNFVSSTNTNTNRMITNPTNSLASINNEVLTNTLNYYQSLSNPANLNNKMIASNYSSNNNSNNYTNTSPLLHMTTTNNTNNNSSILSPLITSLPLTSNSNNISVAASIRRQMNNNNNNNNINNNNNVSNNMNTTNTTKKSTVGGGW